MWTELFQIKYVNLMYDAYLFICTKEIVTSVWYGDVGKPKKEQFFV